MTEWSGGYATNVGYVNGFYRELAPNYLKAICKLQGIVEPTGPMSYLELGCGKGLTLNLIAASNPASQFFGVDFMPEHVVEARRQAAMAEVSNVRYIEKSFEEIASNLSEVPDCEVISLHGVYSWIGDSQKKAVKDIIKAKLKPGGLLYLSYNCAAGWAQIANLQAMLHMMITKPGKDPFTVIRQSLEYLRRLRDANFGLFTGDASITRLLDSLAKSDLRYLYHEYGNAHWRPIYFHELVREMETCKLTFVGSCNPIENSEQLTMSPELAEIVREELDPHLRETMRDLHCNKRFRKDLFIRGKTQRTEGQRLQSLRQWNFALIKPPSDLPTTITVPRGKLDLGKDMYKEALSVLLNDGPGSFERITTESSELIEIITLLLQLGFIHPVSDELVGQPSTLKFNRALLENCENNSPFVHLASPVTGSGVRLSRDLRFNLHQLLSKDNPRDLSHAIITHENQFIDREHEPASEKQRLTTLQRIWIQLGFTQ